MGSASQSYVQGHFHQHVSQLLSEKGEEINQGPESKLSVSIWGESGQWKYDKQLHKQQVPFTQYTKGPSAPPPCSVTLSILVQVPLWHPAVLRSWFHLPLPFFLALTCFRP